MKTLSRMTKSLSNGRLLPRSIRMAAVLMCTLAIYGQSSNQKHYGEKPAPGQRVFDTTCASCHGLNGRGGEHAPNITTQPGIVKLSDNELLKSCKMENRRQECLPLPGWGKKRLAEDSRLSSGAPRQTRYSDHFGRRCKWQESLRRQGRLRGMPHDPRRRRISRARSLQLRSNSFRHGDPQCHCECRRKTRRPQRTCTRHHHRWTANLRVGQE